jgi:OFA family oxalate/formate antiporter-like MFS transporter
MAKRSRQLLSIVGIQLLLGGVYAWSAFVPALRSGYGFSSAQTQTVFGLTIGVLCIFSLFSGYLTTRSNPRDLFRAAGILLTLSYLGAGRYGSSYALLLLFISLLGGAGVACGYLCSLATVLRAYPDRQGLASGVVVAGYSAEIGRAHV